MKRLSLLCLLAAFASGLCLRPAVGQDTPHNFNQVSLSIFDSTDNLIRVNATPVVPGSTLTPHDANQVFLSIFDDVNNAIYVNCVDGCGGSAEELHVNGGSAVVAPNFGALPAADTGRTNMVWQQSGSNISAELPSVAQTDTFLANSAMGIGASAVPGSDGNGNSTFLDIEGSSTFSTSLKQLRPINIAVTWNPSANAFIGAGINIDFETDASNTKNVASIVGLSVLSAHNGSGTTSFLEGAVYDTYLQGSGLATGGILAATYSVENDATSAGTIPFTHGLDVTSGVGGASTTTRDATMYVFSPVTTSGVMTHHYGLYVEDQATGGGTKNPDPWAIYVAGGKSSFGGNVLIPGIESTTGQRFVCVTTTGQLVSSTTACVGT